MFDILVYLYETYYRPEACPDSLALAKKLSSVGFEEEEIVEALGWLDGLAEVNEQLAVVENDLTLSSFRIYTEHEYNALGSGAIGFVEYLISAKILNVQQREILLERAMATNESPIALNKLKVIVLMLLWSQGRESDMLLYDDLLLSEELQDPRLLH